MGRRRRTRKRIILRPPKRIPKVFSCPSCGTGVVNVVVNKKEGKVVVVCGGCHLRAVMDVAPGLLPVDYYNRFVDMYYRGEIRPEREEVVSIERLKTMSESEGAAS